MDVIELLTQQHREAEQVIARLEQAGEDERAPLVAELQRRLELHMQLEEQVVYPFLAAKAEDGEDEVEEAVAEHQLARQGVQQLVDEGPDFPGFDGLVAMVKAGVQHHVSEEETEVFPDLREHASEAELQDLARRCQELADQAPVSGQAATDLSSMTKEELYEQAKAADISGRSDMTKDELVEALSKQRG